MNPCSTQKQSRQDSFRGSGSSCQVSDLHNPLCAIQCIIPAKEKSGSLQLSETTQHCRYTKNVLFQHHTSTRASLFCQFPPQMVCAPALSFNYWRKSPLPDSERKRGSCVGDPRCVAGVHRSLASHRVQQHAWPPKQPDDSTSSIPQQATLHPPCKYPTGLMYRTKWMNSPPMETHQSLD